MDITEHYDLANHVPACFANNFFARRHLVLLLDSRTGEVWLSEIPDSAGTPVGARGELLANEQLDTDAVTRDEWNEFLEATASLREQIAELGEGVDADDERDELVDRVIAEAVDGFRLRAVVTLAEAVENWLNGPDRRDGAAYITVECKEHAITANSSDAELDDIYRAIVGGLEIDADVLIDDDASYLYELRDDLRAERAAP